MMLTFTQIKLAGFGLALMASAWFGRHYTVLSYEAQIAEQNRQVAELQAANEKKTVQIVTRYVDRIQEVKVAGETIIKEVPIYVTKESDARCVIPAGFVRVHDDAAANRVSEPTGNAHAAPSGVALSAVAETVAGNYATCHQNAEQLKAIQDWLKATHGAQVQKN